MPLNIQGELDAISSSHMPTIIIKIYVIYIYTPYAEICHAYIGGELDMSVSSNMSTILLEIYVIYVHYIYMWCINLHISHVHMSYIYRKLPRRGCFLTCTMMKCKFRYMYIYIDIYLFFVWYM